MRLYTFLPGYMSLEEFINSSPDRQATQLVYLPYKEGVKDMVPIGTAEVTLCNDLRTAVDFVLKLNSNNIAAKMAELKTVGQSTDSLIKIKGDLK